MTSENLIDQILNCDFSQQKTSKFIQRLGVYCDPDDGHLKCSVINNADDKFNFLLSYSMYPSRYRIITIEEAQKHLSYQDIISDQLSMIH